MHYFISTREDYNTSAIELAQVKRMQLFDALNVSNRIVEVEKNDFSEECQRKLGTFGRVLNIFQYFQNLPHNKRNLKTVLDQILNKNGLLRQGNDAFNAGRKVIQTHLYNGRLFYVDFLDQYGFTVKRQFFSYNHLNYIEYFDDQAHLMMREFVNGQGMPIIREYFCQSTQNKAMLTLLELTYQGRDYRFNKIEEFQAFFLDQLVKADDHAVFYCDRCTQVLPAFAKMKTRVPRYVVLHSALTPSGYLDQDPYTVYQPITTLTRSHDLNGVISSTQAEAEDVKKKLLVQHSYAIPVTFVKQEKQVPFAQRKKGQLIAVARVDEVKQLDHLIQTVIDLKKRFPQLDLAIYGNSTSTAEDKKLKQLVQEKQASGYIHFCGFAQNLAAVYDSAQLEVLTSKNEGFAMALLEAQAHGVPAVSYDINYGPSEIIVNGVSGRLVPANDRLTLKEVMADLLAHPEVLARFSVGAYQAAQRFDFSHLKDKWQQFLRSEHLK